MSFSITTPQFQARIKDVTRRFGWWFLKPGDEVCGVEKCMGLKKGESILRLGRISIVSSRGEPLNAITQEDVIREGFPEWTPQDFVEMMTHHYKIKPTKRVNRIEFIYLD